MDPKFAKPSSTVSTTALFTVHILPEPRILIYFSQCRVGPKQTFRQSRRNVRLYSSVAGALIFTPLK